MVDLHSYVVHFPIALFICAVACEMVALINKSRLFSNTSLVTSVGAALFAIAAVITGLIAALKVPDIGEVHQVAESHETFGFGVLAATLLFAGIKLWSNFSGKQKGAEALVAIGLIGILLVILTAHEGGQLVREYGVGVEKQVINEHSTPRD
jgi:uncharacterized membrane protein